MPRALHEHIRCGIFSVRRKVFMCLAVPLQIEKIHENNTASVKQGSSLLDVDISLLSDASVGDYVIIHAGYAIEVLELEEAETRIEMFDQLKIDNGN